MSGMIVCWPNPSKAVQETVPDFRLPILDGGTFEMKKLIGQKTVLMNFWATWCIPCRKEMIHLQKLYDQHKDKGFEVLAISIDDASRLSQVKPFVRKYNYTFPVLLDTDSIVIKKFQTQPDVPFSVLIDRRGRIVRRFLGYKPGDEETVKRDVMKLLDGQ
jgi:peroxiredoxin